MRCILHSDINNFFASVECACDPSLRGVPLAVCGDPEARHGIVLAKNDLAKAVGVRTAETIWQARQKCPGLKIVKPDYQKYLRYSRMMRSIYADYTDYIEPFGLDEAWLDVTGHRKSGVEIANELRARAKTELGLTVSVGVSFNKVFAKLGSDLKKPDATTEITPENYRQRVWPLPVDSLLYVGPKTRRRLQSRNLFTIGDLARCDVNVLRLALGKNGEMLWNFACGRDVSPVLQMGESAMEKSVSNSTTPPRDLTCDADVRLVLLLLAESVAGRLRADGLRGGVVSLQIRDCELNITSCQRRTVHPTALSNEIANSALSLFREHYRWNRPVRSLGVSVSELSDPNGTQQLCMFEDTELERRYKLEGTVEQIRTRFGHGAIGRASLLADKDINSMNPRAAPVLLPGGRHGR